MKSRGRTGTLKARIVGVGVVAAVLPLACFGFWTVRECTRLLAADVGREVGRDAAALATALDGVLTERRRALGSFAQQDLVRANVPEDLDGVVTNLAAGYCRSDAAVAELSCFDERGRETASSALVGIGSTIDARRASWISAALGRSSGSVACETAGLGPEHLIALTVPVFPPGGGGGRPNAVLALLLKREAALSPDVRLAEGRVALVLDAQGGEIACTAPGGASRELAAVAGRVAARGGSAWFVDEDWIGAESGTRGGGGRWTVVVLEPTRIAFASAYSLARTAALIGVVACAAAVVLALAVGRRIARPLEALTAVATRVSHEGELDLEVEAKGTDEVGQLAAAFRDMVAKLREKQAALLRTIAELREHEAALARANQELLRASKHKSEFLASMTHELRTPLNAMIGYTSLTLGALRSTLPEKHLANLTNAERAARSLLGLINEVLDFSKLEAGATKLLIEKVDLREIVDEAHVFARGFLEQRGAPIELLLDLPEGDLSVESDFTKLKQILNNLVSNAIKFTEKGRVLLHVRASEDGGGFRVDVEDSGIGIPEERIPELFQSFKQIDGSIQKRFAGTGLGLAITKGFCDLLGIGISLTSKPGAGTTFSLAVPRVFGSAAASGTGGRVAAAPAPATHELAQALAAHAPPDGTPDGDAERRAIVACAASPAIIATIAGQLRDLPLDVVAALDGVALDGRLVWAIVAEPGGPWFDALGTIQASRGAAHAPVILCSQGAAGEGRSLGQVRHLVRPISAEQLVEALAPVHGSSKVLVVDDDASSRDLVRQALADAGMAVEGAASGREALARLTSAPGEIGAVVLDLLMPEMDGFAVLEAIRADARLRSTPVVILTGKELSAEEQRTIERGAELLLTKGQVAPGELARRVGSLFHAVEQGDADTVLVVDDNPMNLDVVGDTFEQASYTVLRASSGAEAIELARGRRPSAILMDLAMPGMDGFEATRRLKRDPVAGASVVIACSAFSSDDFRLRAREAGCEGFVTKPIEPERLVRQVKRLVLAARIERWVASRCATVR